MFYESHRIQPEGGLFKIGEETRSEPRQHGQSEGGKTRKRKARPCKHCGTIKRNKHGACPKCYEARLKKQRKSKKKLSGNKGLFQPQPRSTDQFGKKYLNGPKPVVTYMEPFPKHWLMEEIFMHDNRQIFPDWGSLAMRYFENKKRDHKAARQKRKEAANAQKREYRQRPECKARAAERQREKLKCPKFRTRKNLSKRLWELLTQSGEQKKTSVMKYVGCSKRQLIAHLESKFSKGMTWDNYGTYWHVDHILPCASFDHSDPKQVAQCWHWTNLQPLMAIENVKKGDSITNPQMSLLLCITH